MTQLHREVTDGPHHGEILDGGKYKSAIITEPSSAKMQHDGQPADEYEVFRHD
jgi:hypothetical protein